MKNERKITLSEKESSLSIYKYDAGNDPREQSYTNITIIGTENEK